MRYIYVGVCERERKRERERERERERMYVQRHHTDDCTGERPSGSLLVCRPPHNAVVSEKSCTGELGD